MSPLKKFSDKKTYPRVTIIILNWNRWEDTLECLESVFRITYPTYDVIVVDNGSEDGSFEKIKAFAEGTIQVESDFFPCSNENKPKCYITYSREEAEAGGGREGELSDVAPQKRLIIINNEKNFGFAEGNNIAIRYTMKSQSPGYVLLLNNDTVVEKTFLDELVFHAESDKKIGFAGPKTLYYNYYGRKDVINFAGGRFIMWIGRALHIGFREVDAGQYDAISDVDYVEGSCLLAKGEVIKKIGLLDSSFFTYWEDTDLCLRARKGGYRLLYVPGAKIWHKVTASNKGGAKNYYFVRNRIFLLRRYATRGQLLFFIAFFFGFEFWYLNGISLIFDRNFNLWKSFIKGVYDGISTPLKKR